MVFGRLGLGLGRIALGAGSGLGSSPSVRCGSAVRLPRLGVLLKVLEPRADEPKSGRLEEGCELKERERALTWVEYEVAAASAGEELGTPHDVLSRGDLAWRGGECASAVSVEREHERA